MTARRTIPAALGALVAALVLGASSAPTGAALGPATPLSNDVVQNLSLATRVAQRVLVMNKGTIVFAGTPAELASDRDIEARYLGV